MIREFRNGSLYRPASDRADCGGARLGRRWTGLLTVGTMLVVTAPAWATSAMFLDDYNISVAHWSEGFWGPTEGLFQTFSWYRPLATLSWSLVYAAPDQLWLPRLIGVALHILSTVCAMALLRKAGGSKAGAATLLVLFGLAPYSLEAVAWPATLPTYALPLAMTLGGSLVAAQARSRLGIAAGSALAGTSLLLQEQVLVVLAVAIAWIAFARSRIKEVLTGLAIPVGLLFPASLIGGSQNSRLAGPDGASLGHLWRNADEAVSYLRATPVGDLFWSDAGVESWHLVLGALLGCSATSVVLLGNFPGSDGDRDPDSTGLTKPRGLPYAILAAGVVVVLGSIAPFLLSGAPYITARFAYLPTLGVAAAAAALVEVLWRFKDGKAAVILLLAPVVVWAPTALISEGMAYRTQFAADRAHLASLEAALDFDALRNSGAPLVVAGLPGRSNQRPQFGEHILGLGGASVLLKGLQHGLPPDDLAGRLDFRSGLAGLCVTDHEAFGLLPEWVADHPGIWGQGGQRREQEQTIFAVAHAEGWTISRAGSPDLTASSMLTTGQLPSCPQVT